MKWNFYVDDCLKSQLNSEAAKKVATDLGELLAKGGFHLTKQLSNEKKVIHSIPGSEQLLLSWIWSLRMSYQLSDHLASSGVLSKI